MQQMSRRRFLQAMGVAATAPALAKAASLIDAKGAGWRAYDMGDYLILRVADDAVVADQTFAKPVVIEGGERWIVREVRFLRPVNVAEGTRFTIEHSWLQGNPDVPALTVEKQPMGVRLSDLYVDPGGGTGLKFNSGTKNNSFFVSA